MNSNVEECKGPITITGSVTKDGVNVFVYSGLFLLQVSIPTIKDYYILLLIVSA